MSDYGHVTVNGDDLPDALEREARRKEAKQAMLDAWGLRPFDRCSLPNWPHTILAVRLASLAVKALDEEGLLR